jgi:endonuclease YncB( thermonuclease family)
MRRVGLVVLVVLLSFATPALAQTSRTVTVERVVDGDTIEARPRAQSFSRPRFLNNSQSACSPEKANLPSVQRNRSYSSS